MVKKRSRSSRKRRKAKQKARKIIKQRKTKIKKMRKKSTRKKMKKKAKAKKAPQKKKLSKIVKMSEEKTFNLIKKYSIPIPKQFFCTNEKQLNLALKKLDFPIVMKISGKNIIHKSELRGIKTDIENEKTALDTFLRMKKIKDVEKVLVQEHLTGTELILGAKEDANFGHIVSVGIGGIYVEILKDVTFRVCPITITDAENMVKELRGWEILAGARGKNAINFKNLYEILVKLSILSTKNKIKEMDINPLFCTKDKCYAADVKIILK